MKKSLFAFIAFLFIGCGGDKPEDVVKNFYANLGSCNLTKVEPYLYIPTDGMKEEFARDYMRMCENMKMTDIKTEVVSKNDDSAKVKITGKIVNGGENSETITVIKVDGKWKINFQQ